MFRQLTAEHCADVARRLRDGLAHFGVPVNPTSDVGRMLAALAWLGGFPPDSLQPDAAWAADRERARQAFPLIEQATRIADAIVATRHINGARERVFKLRKRLDRLASQDEQAQDFLFELEVGARFARLGITISFEEPDIVVHTSDGHRFGVACKRPRNVQRLRERLSEGVKQVFASGEQGLVVIGVEPLFHRSQDPLRPTVLYLGDTEMLRAEAEKILDAAVAEAESEIREAFKEGIAGILFCGVITGWAKDVAPDRDAYHFQWIHRSISHPAADDVAGVIERKIFPGVDS